MYEEVDERIVELDVTPLDATDVEGAQVEPPAVRERSRLRRLLVPLLILVVVGGAFAAWWFLLREPAADPPMLLELIDDPVQAVDGPIPTPWIGPSDIALDGSEILVLDSGNNRILRLDETGALLHVLCEADGCAFTLDEPSVLETDGSRIYVGNVGTGTIEVISNNGDAVASLELPVGEDGTAPIPSGIALSGEDLLVSDAANGWVVRMTTDGELLGFAGPEDEPITMGEPGGLTVGPAGDLFVAARGEGVIQKISPIGRLLTGFSMVPGSTTISEPVDVAVTDDGSLILMVDAKRRTVHVFGSGANYYGITALDDQTQIDSTSVVIEPITIDLAADRMVILDARRGIAVFSFDPAYWLGQR